MTSPLASQLNAAEIHRRLAGRWRNVLAELGLAPRFLTNKHGPCPACGGTDRCCFDDKHLHGDFFCNACGAGDGFKLLQLVNGWSFSEARRAVIDTMGGYEIKPPPRRPSSRAPLTTASDNKAPTASPPARVKTLLRPSAKPDTVPDVIAYLRSRHLWPLPLGCTLRAHVQVEYRRSGEGKTWTSEGMFPCLVARVVDLKGEIVTSHVTYIDNGRKLARPDGAGLLLPARKILSPVAGRRGCAVRLLPLNGDVLGIAEGIETALAASVLHDGVPVWAALNTSLLAKFEPPPEVGNLLIFADRDVAGLEAAWNLRNSLGERCKVELRLPPPRAGDWADELEARQP